MHAEGVDEARVPRALLLHPRWRHRLGERGALLLRLSLDYRLRRAPGSGLLLRAARRSAAAAVLKEATNASHSLRALGRVLVAAAFRVAPD
eukprot:9087299-Alexandrium_andersonii.AAC.1